MGKSIVIFICLFSLLGLTQASDEKSEFFVEGVVYCDPCRSLFKTNLYKPIKDAVVFLKCANPKTRNMTLIEMGVTDANGMYRVHIEGDYKNDICKVELQSGHVEDCKENPCAESKSETFRVSLTHNNNNNNTNGNVRKVNDFFYYPKTPALKECIREFKNMKHMPQVQDIECASFFDM